MLPLTNRKKQPPRKQGSQTEGAVVPLPFATLAGTRVGFRVTNELRGRIVFVFWIAHESIHSALACFEVSIESSARAVVLPGFNRGEVVSTQ